MNEFEVATQPDTVAMTLFRGTIVTVFTGVFLFVVVPLAIERLLPLVRGQ